MTHRRGTHLPLARPRLRACAAPARACAASAGGGSAAMAQTGRASLKEQRYDRQLRYRPGYPPWGLHPASSAARAGPRGGGRWVRPGRPVPPRARSGRTSVPAWGQGSGEQRETGGRLVPEPPGTGGVSLGSRGRSSSLCASVTSFSAPKEGKICEIRGVFVTDCRRVPISASILFHSCPKYITKLIKSDSRLLVPFSAL